MGIGAQTRDILRLGHFDEIEWEAGRPRAVAAYRTEIVGAVLFVVERDQPRAIVVTASPRDGGEWQDEEEFGFSWSLRPFESVGIAEVGGLAALGGRVEVAGPERAFRVATGRAAAEVTSLTIERDEEREELDLGTGGAFVYGWPITDGGAPLAIFRSESDRLKVALG